MSGLFSKKNDDMTRSRNVLNFNKRPLTLIIFSYMVGIAPQKFAIILSLILRKRRFI